MPTTTAAHLSQASSPQQMVRQCQPDVTVINILIGQHLPADHHGTSEVACCQQLLLLRMAHSNDLAPVHLQHSLMPALQGVWVGSLQALKNTRTGG